MLRIYKTGEFNLNRREKITKMILAFSVSCSLILSCSFNPISSIENEIFGILPEVYDSWVWSEYEMITETTTGWAYSTKIAIDADNNAHVVWYDSSNDLLGSGSDSDIFYRYYDSSSETWSSVELVSSESASPSAHPDVIVDTLGNVHVSWADSSDYLGADTDMDVFYKKKNAGGSWTLTDVVSTDSTLTSMNVVIDTDINENVYVLWSDLTDILGADADEDIFLRIYNSTSSSWLSTQLVSSGSFDTSTDAEISVDSHSGDVHIIWEEFDALHGSDIDCDIFYRNWNIYSSLFSDLELVSTGSIMDSLNPDIGLSQNGDLYVVWEDQTEYLESGTDKDVFYKKYDSSLNSWLPVETVSTESTSFSSNPRISLDTNDFVFVVWNDYTDYQDSSAQWDIFLKYKDSNTNLWTMTDVVSTRSDDHATLPDFALDSYGFISCVWTDFSDVYLVDSDQDIYFRRFAGIPSTPILANIVPNPSTIGDVSLNWKPVCSAEDYLIYRDTSYIFSITDIELLAIVTDSSYVDILNETGDYYYVVYARNEYGISGISNVEHVEIIKDGLFASLDLTEILIIAGFVLGLQIIGSVLTYSLVKSRSSKGSSSKRKK